VNQHEADSISFMKTNHLITKICTNYISRLWAEHRVFEC